MIRNLFSCIIVSVSAFSLLAQEPEIYASSPVYMYYNISELMNVYDNETRKIVDRHAGIAGSPYVFDDFIPGTVFSRIEKTAFQVDLNMNAVTDLFEFEYQGDIFEMPNFAYDSVVIGESVFIPVSIVENDRVKIFSMEVMASDPNGNSLLKKHNVKFMNRVDEKPFIDAQPAHYKHFPPSYYLYLSNSRLVALDNLRRLADDEAMPSNLNSYIRKNKIGKRKEDDLTKLFFYITENMK